MLEHAWVSWEIVILKHIKTYVYNEDIWVLDEMKNMS